MSHMPTSALQLPQHPAHDSSYHVSRWCQSEASLMAPDMVLQPPPLHSCCCRPPALKHWVCWAADCVGAWLVLRGDAVRNRRPSRSGPATCLALFATRLPQPASCACLQRCSAGRDSLGCHSGPLSGQPHRSCQSASCGPCRVPWQKHQQHSHFQAVHQYRSVRTL